MPSQPLPPLSQPMGFLSDIHGNLEALQAVLDELEQESIREIFVAGDLLYGGDAPLEVWKRLQEVEAKCVRGLSDTALCLVDPKTLVAANPNEEIMARRFAETRRKLGDLVIERLRRLPERLRIPLIDGSEIVLVHGSPADPSTEVSHDMSDEELLSLVGDDPADIIVCGGSHVPFQRILPETVLANVGSVGSAPGGRHAHYTVITPRMDGAAIEQRYLSLSKRRS